MDQQLVNEIEKRFDEIEKRFAERFQKFEASMNVRFDKFDTELDKIERQFNKTRNMLRFVVASEQKRAEEEAEEADGDEDEEEEDEEIDSSSDSSASSGRVRRSDRLKDVKRRRVVETQDSVETESDGSEPDLGAVVDLKTTESDDGVLYTIVTAEGRTLDAVSAYEDRKLKSHIDAYLVENRDDAIVKRFTKFLKRVSDAAWAKREVPRYDKKC